MHILYQAFLGRAADSGGYHFWTTALNNGTPRSEVIHGFLYSQEFYNLCARYGIEHSVDAYSRQRAYVRKMFELFLGRMPMPKDTNWWAIRLQKGTYSAETYLNNIIYSPEFSAKRLSNWEYLKVLYKGVLGRKQTPSNAELNYWNAKLSLGTSRYYIVKSFIYSQEFKNHVASYGIKKADNGANDTPNVTIKNSANHLTAINNQPHTTQYVWKIGSKVAGQSRTLDLSRYSWGTYHVSLHITDRSGHTLGAKTDVTISRPAISYFIWNLYKHLLGRENHQISTSELLDWTNWIVIDKHSVEDVIDAFLKENEFKNRHLSDSAFVSALYKALLNRNPDEAERNNYIARLGNGMSRRDVSKFFIYSREFIHIIVQGYGITHVNNGDNVAPVITLKGKNPLTLYKYYTYNEPGAIVTDNVDRDISVEIEGSVNTSIPGTYTITYRAEDKNKNVSIKHRTVIVRNEVRPQVIVDTHAPTDANTQRPSNVVDAFIKAFIADDKDKVSELVGANEKLLAMLYDNPDATAFLKGIYSRTYKIEGTHQEAGDASVTISFVDGGGHHKGGFELMRSIENKWIIKLFY